MKAIALAVAAAVGVAPPPGWVSNPGPGQAFEGARQCANYSPQWIVSSVAGSVKATKRDYARRESRATVLRLPEGQLLGSDEGEFGGSLKWQGTGKSTARELLAENVIEIVAASAGSGALVFTGLAHMVTDYGRIYSIAIRAGEPVVTKVADIGNRPVVVQARPDGSVLMVTPQGLLRFSRGRLERQCAANLEHLNPISLAVASDQDVYVGMGLFIARLRLAGATCQVDWFVRTECQRFRVKEYECECSR